ncbi:MAG TPA: alpha-galactosidase, partial [Sphingomonas sp.]|nr:alpha-galactosidase [Sphingomonas sp.]
ALGVRIAVTGCRADLRNGFQSWDGCYFVAPGTPGGDGPAGKAPTLGFAMTALLPTTGAGATVLGVERADRFQTRFRFGGTADAPTIDVETLLDRVPGARAMEPLVLFTDDAVEPALRRWSRLLADASPIPPRLPARRVTGWCSWYNHYAAIDEPTILAELAGAAAFRDREQVPLDVFLVDDGFTPEMGDWLQVKPQFPRGMKPIVEAARDAGFMPGLWIAPFLVGNRSRLAAEHPDWLVRDARSGQPFVHARFWGEFRWHKRSEEYHVIDVTHPAVADYLSDVFRTWSDWGVRYFKADFLLAGADYGPDEVTWHVPGLSRIAIWRRMMILIREAIPSDAVVAGCGCPLWASVGLIETARIGRDVGVTWEGEYSAESLLRDLATRNHANGILWQSDPDCVLLRDRFHGMNDAQIRSLAAFAGLSGGALMTSDTLAALPADRSQLFAGLLRSAASRCDFPRLGEATAVIEQVALLGDGRHVANRFNPTNEPIEGIAPFTSVSETRHL